MQYSSILTASAGILSCLPRLLPLIYYPPPTARHLPAGLHGREELLCLQYTCNTIPSVSHYSAVLHGQYTDSAHLILSSPADAVKMEEYCTSGCISWRRCDIDSSLSVTDNAETTLNQVVQQSQQAREREQQLNQQLTETSEQVCIVHELKIDGSHCNRTSN